MGVATERYIRKPLYVDAVRVSRQNFEQVAEWCDGDIRTDSVTGKQYIKVRVQYPKNDRQTQAFVGDWVLYTDRGYKVYIHKAFIGAFDLVEDDQGGTSGDIPRDNSDNPVGAAKEEELLAEGAQEFAEEDRKHDTGKRILSQQEQAEMGPDAVREAVKAGEVVLEQDLAA